MLLVYTPRITNRNRYIFRFIFSECMGVSIMITDNPEELKNYSGPKISYGASPVGGELFFQAKNLLFESGITEQNINISEWNGLKIFFATPKNSALPFDIFSASFYLISRYEEYLPHIRDKYDRFDAHESLSYRGGFLRRPIIDLWSQNLLEILLSTFPDLSYDKKEYCYVSTLDIDNAYAFREKGFMRSLGGYLKALVLFDFKEVIERTKVLFGTLQDPYDTYDYQLEIQKRYALNPIYFFLVADYGVNDKNLPVDSPQFQALIKKIADYCDVGIHPSFGSSSDMEKLRTEVGRLSRILHRDITKSRQHFLRLTFPDTYRNLIDLDITDDYTMGYASEIGFRAGTSRTFNFYDLDTETETKLRIHPFAIMEATLKYYMKVPIDDVIETIKPLVDDVRKVNGTFITLWHNETLSNYKQWQGWREIYEEMVKLCLPINKTEAN